MNPLTEIGNAYLRWRHSRGYGVHSPFAYNLVTMVVSPGKYGYYGYAAIDRCILTPGVASYPHLRRDARMLLRLLVNLRSPSLLICSPCREVFAAAAKAAGIPSRSWAPGDPLPAANASANTPASGAAPAPALVITGAVTDSAPVGDFLRGGGAVMAIDAPKPLTQEILDAMTDGVVFAGKRIIIAVPRKEMAATLYSMKL